MRISSRYPVAYDFSRLASRIFSRTPNGIDRVDMAYASHFLAEGTGEDCGVLFLGPFGTRKVMRRSAIRAIGKIEAHFRETADGADAALLRAVAAWTAGAKNTSVTLAERQSTELRANWLLKAGYTLQTLAAAGGRVKTALPEKARYLCVSQFPLSERGAYDWLTRRRDVKAVFFIHDLLPMQYPEYFRAPELERHQRRLEQLARVGSAALVSSRVVATALRDAMKAHGRPTFPIHISPMPLVSRFSIGPIASELADARPYFIQCGTIEPRKNHLTILHVWRDLAERLGDDTPKLILVGARGWENENVIDLLDRSPAIRRHVLELRNVNTPTLVELMRGARALLMPSFSEGYGLPVAEALALGTPVIASDIPIFHEVTAGQFEPVHPLDGKGWLSAVKRATERRSAAVRGEGVRTQRQDDTGNFASLRAFLDDLT